MALTKQQFKSGFNVIVAVTETIREAREIPAGTLYAALMQYGCDIEAFEKLIAIVTGSGLVEKRGNLLRWVGPEVV
jgi:hypothetical protein